MKLRFFIICAVLMLMSFAGARDFKIGYINSERLRTDYPAFKDAQTQFDRDVAAWEEEAAKLEEEIVKMQTELEQQALILSEDKKRERQMLIQQKQREYQRFVEEVYSKAEQRNAELTMPLIEKINKTIADLAESQGYDLVLDVSGGNIAYIDKNLDITDQLLDELQK